MSKVQLDNIIKVYDDILGVEDANFSAETEEYLPVVGPSGCGKSTTQRMIGGFETVTDGDRIRLGDENQQTADTV